MPRVTQEKERIMAGRIGAAFVSGSLAFLFFAAGSDGVGLGSPALAQNVAGEMARLNPNSATEDQLKAVPQLTPELVALIQQRRPFATIGDFNKALAGKLDAGKTRELFTALFVPIDLNTASRADIMLIPGMTARMAHEFEEYRPYRNIDQFNREIGKYVNANEVARLRSYVTLK
jgi:DNA uptake protein ComE-like DNA-binding protein